jgi:hypothetical protein
MIFLVYPVVAIVGATIHNLRHRDADRAKKIETYLIWWLVAAIGVGNIVGGLFHVFDGPEIAEEIGFTRGDGGFQFENAMADIAIGVIAVMCAWFRGNFILAVLVAITISWWGDGYGHIYQAEVNDNHDPDNTGIVLYSDFILPAVAWVLYILFRRAGGDEAARTAPGAAKS